MTPLCPSAMPGPSANAVGSTFKIYASRLGHCPASNCHHTLVTTAASSLLGSLLLPLPPTVSSDMWPEGSCQNLRKSTGPLHMLLRGLPWLLPRLR